MTLLKSALASNVAANEDIGPIDEAEAEARFLRELEAKLHGISKCPEASHFEHSFGPTLTK